MISQRAPEDGRGDNKNNESAMLTRTAINHQGLADLIMAIETSPTGTHDHAAQALAFVRDGIITGEGPTTKGRVHFSRELDAADVVVSQHVRETALKERWNEAPAEVEALLHKDRYRKLHDLLTSGRVEIRAFLRRKWSTELDYRLKKTLW